ncbi:MAG TPA: polysaccharide biosynthesis/export family protein [Thermoguttaceae bacterium]|nr:polysaccharide biosynthesis/export family protein [Thermoguttaceae bacterium]
MNEILSLWLVELGRTTLYLTAAAAMAALALRLARVRSPRVHRAAWCFVLLVGWLFVRMPVAVPWYEPTADRSEIASASTSKKSQDIEPTQDAATQPSMVSVPSSENQTEPQEIASRGEEPIVGPLASSENRANTKTLVEIAEQPAKFSPPPHEPNLPDSRIEPNKPLFGEASTPPKTTLAHKAASTPEKIVVATPPKRATAPARSGFSLSAAFSSIPWGLTLATAWAAGLFVALLRWLAGYVRSIRRMSTALAPDEASLHQWRALLTEHGVTRDIPLRLTDNLGPLLCRWPDGYELVVPAALWSSLAPSARASIMRHELAHYQRGDVWKSLAMRLAALPHWFNPVAWRAVRRFDEAAEWACDEAAVAGERKHTDYARTLLALAESSLGGGSCHPAMSRWNLTARVQRLLNPSTAKDSIMKKTILLVLAAALVAFCLIRVDLVAKTPAEVPLPPEESPSELLSPVQTEPRPLGSGRPAKNPNAEPTPPLPDGRGSDARPHEGAMISLPTYRVEPPDILRLEIMKLVPKLPYRLAAWDVLQIKVVGALVDQPIDNYYLIEADGVIHLGPAYGKVNVGGMTLDEAEAAVTKKLSVVLAQPEVAVTLARAGGLPPVEGAYLVGPDGTINLRKYGSVHVAGKTLVDIKQAIDKQLSKYLDSPDVSVEVSSYNSKVYYVIVRAKDKGDSVLRVPNTGKETVLDAVAQLRGLRVLPTTKIWLARPIANDKNTVLAIDFGAIAEGRDTATNYQLLPGDRVFLDGADLVASGGPLVSMSAKPTAPALRYEGRTFAEWKTSLETELSPARRIEAIRALASFGARGHGKNAAEAILRLTRECGYSSALKTDVGRMSSAAMAAFCGHDEHGGNGFADTIPPTDGVAALCGELKEGNEKSRIFVLNTLRQLGPKAVDATPALAELINGNLPWESSQTALWTLLATDPSAETFAAVLRDKIARTPPLDRQTALEYLRVISPSEIHFVRFFGPPPKRPLELSPRDERLLTLLADYADDPKSPVRPEATYLLTENLRNLLGSLETNIINDGHTMIIDGGSDTTKNLKASWPTLSVELRKTIHDPLRRAMLAYISLGANDETDRQRLRNSVRQLTNEKAFLLWAKDAVEGDDKKLSEALNAILTEFPPNDPLWPKTSTSPWRKQQGRGAQQPDARVGLSFVVGQTAKMNQFTESGSDAPPRVWQVPILIRIFNSGNLPLTDVKINYTVNSALVPTDATEGFTREGNRLTWKIDSLRPNTATNFNVLCTIISKDKPPECTATVTTAQGARDERKATLQIPEEEKKIVPIDAPPSAARNPLAPREESMNVETPEG